MPLHSVFNKTTFKITNMEKFQKLKDKTFDHGRKAFTKVKKDAHKMHDFAKKRIKPLSGKQKRTIIFATAAIIIAIFWYSAALQESFYGAISILDSYIAENPKTGISVFLGLAAVSAILSPFSSAPLVPPAILIWGTKWTVAFLVVGWALGGLIAYIVGRYAGYPILRRFPGFHKIQYYRHKLPEGKEFAYVLLLRLALPSELMSYALGIIRYHFWKYLLATVLTEIPFALLTVYASRAIIEIRPLEFAFLLLIGLIFFGIVLLIARRKA